MIAPSPEPRWAVVGDADELARLHAIGLGLAVDDAWRRTCRDDLARRLFQRDSCLVAFVIDAPTGRGLASAAVGFIHPVIRTPGNPAGRTAHLASVATTSRFRRRGFATAIARAFVKEVTAQG